MQDTSFEGIEQEEMMTIYETAVIYGNDTYESEILTVEIWRNCSVSWITEEKNGKTGKT